MPCRRSKVARSFWGQKILRPGHRDALFLSENVDNIFYLSPSKNWPPMPFRRQNKTNKALRYGNIFIFCSRYYQSNTQGLSQVGGSFSQVIWSGAPWCSVTTVSLSSSNMCVPCRVKHCSVDWNLLISRRVTWFTVNVVWCACVRRAVLSAWIVSRTWSSCVAMAPVRCAATECMNARSVASRSKSAYFSIEYSSRTSCTGEVYSDVTAVEWKVTLWYITYNCE